MAERAKVVPLRTVGFWCAIIMAAAQATSAIRAFVDPSAFADYMGLPMGGSGTSQGFVLVYALRTTLIAFLAAYLAISGRLRALAVISLVALILPLGDAWLSAQAGAPQAIVIRHLGIAAFLGFTSLMLFRTSRTADGS